MTIELFPHQIKGAAFLSASPGTKGLFFGMGTGKTITSLEAVAQIERRKNRQRVLIIAPPIALPMWQQEAMTYLGTSVKILKSGKTTVGLSDILVVSYAIATSRAIELREWLAERDGILICDESHALKSVKAKRTQAILGSGGIASGALYSWMLTGTPITRWNDDMVPFVMRADMAGYKQRLGGNSIKKFELRYTVSQMKQWPGARWPVRVTIGNQRTEELADWVYGGGFAMRVDLEEVFANMPPLTQRSYTIGLDADHELKQQLKDMETMTISEVQSLSKTEALATVRRKLGLAKVKAAVAEIVDRLESGQNVLVGAWHTEVIDELYSALTAKGYEGRRIDGRQPASHKSMTQTLWNEGSLNFIIAQIAAAGVSLNLQHGGTQIIVVEEDWSPSIMDQFYARLWRYGQEKHVHVDTLTSATKLDEALGRISATKQREHEKFNEIGRTQ